MLVAKVTNSSKARFSIGTARCYKVKTIHNSEAVNLWIQSESSSVSRRNQVCSAVSPRSETSVQYISVSGIQGATSAIVLIVIVMCCSCKSP
jgi:hypothetical protein